MMKKLIYILSFLIFINGVFAQDKNLVSIPERVNIQADSAKMNQIIDNEWVAVGIRKPYAIMHDYNLLFNGRPSYRFELEVNDNTLSNHNNTGTKGRAELSYCYATSKDFVGKPTNVFEDAQKMKTVYHYGKGICPQGTSRSYTFSIYVPSNLSPNVSTIFAQWHGMPDRKLVQTPEGEIKMLTDEEFLELYEKVEFKKNVAHEKIKITDKKGNIKYKVGEPTGLLIEQGGYPPLAFEFSKGIFHIKANSDRKWLSDKDDRTNSNPEKLGIMESNQSEYKTSTIAYKMPFKDFPKNCWVTFHVDIDWTSYGGKQETIEKPGMLNVEMSYDESGKMIHKKLVDKEEILIGRNDEDGYYFKFGIYRLASSTIPVVYNLAGYSEK
jgi:heparin lyase